MKIEEIRGIAKQSDIKTGKEGRVIIRAMQEAEGNPICFDTGKTAECGQADGLWREDCK